MKRLNFLVIVSILLACQTKNNGQLSQLEREKIKGELEAIADQIVQSYNSREVNTVFLNYKDFKYCIPGRIMNYIQFIGIYNEFFEKVKTQAYKKVNGDLSYADTDFAIYCFVTTFKIEKKNGETINNNGYTTTLIFKRIRGKWRVIGGHES